MPLATKRVVAAEGRNRSKVAYLGSECLLRSAPYETPHFSLVVACRAVELLPPLAQAGSGRRWSERQRKPMPSSPDQPPPPAQRHRSSGISADGHPRRPAPGSVNRLRRLSPANCPDGARSDSRTATGAVRAAGSADYASSHRSRPIQPPPSFSRPTRRRAVIWRSPARV